MQRLTLYLPNMYGDHHVMEVRRLLLALPGVTEVYASSAFQLAELTYDPAAVSPDVLKAHLDAAGYSEEFELPTEVAVSSSPEAEPTRYFRHTAAYRQTGAVVTFSQNTSYLGRPLWPCPGMGALSAASSEE